MNNQIRRNMSLFPMSIVMELTDLTARQIRYYEQQGLIKPARSKGKQRIFSLNDIDRLLEIKELLDQGVNIAGIKAIYNLKEEEERKKQEEDRKKEEEERKKQAEMSKGKEPRDLSEKELHSLLKAELIFARPGGRAALTQGELSRFFH